MTGLDRFCAVLAFGVGVVLVVLGVLGLFFGCSAHFTLPPVMGVIPALVGWGIVRTGRVAWRVAGPKEVHRWKPSPQSAESENPSK